MSRCNGLPVDDVAMFLHSCRALAWRERVITRAAIFADELTHTKPRDIELVVHPGVNTPALEARYADWKFDWTGERDGLLSQQFADAVKAAGFQLF